MNEAATDCVVFETKQLLPDSWRHFAADGPVRAFNPGLLREGTGWLFAYRIVGPDGARRIGICRLDASLGVVPGSQRALTDRVRFRSGAEYPETATKWFADPRLYRFFGRVFIYWNSGWHEPYNCQFLQELDPTTLQPVGAARELKLVGERQKLEKNWTFFQPEDVSENAAERLFAVYSILPHRIVTGSLAGDGDIVLTENARTEWKLASYPQSHGGLRGGAPAVIRDGVAWSFCHSVHDAASGYRYVPAVYCFSAKAPFGPIAGPVKPIALGNPFGEGRLYDRLNPAVGEVIYPCGAAWDGTRWLVSHGINDEHCAISVINTADVESTLQLCDAAAQSGQTLNRK